MTMQINVDPAALTQEQREAVAGFILAYPGRFLVGSDTWVNARWQYYGDLMQVYRAWLGALPPKVARQVAWGNGAALFGLE